MEARKGAERAKEVTVGKVPLHTYQPQGILHEETGEQLFRAVKSCQRCMQILKDMGDLNVIHKAAC